MHSIDITEDLNIVFKSDFEKKVAELGREIDISLRGIHCLKLSNLKQIKAKYQLDDYDLLLVYIFCDLKDAKRIIFSTPLKLNQTFYSIRKYWHNARVFEQRLNAKFNLHFYMDENVVYDFLSINELNKLKRCKKYNLNFRPLFSSPSSLFPDFRISYADNGDEIGDVVLERDYSEKYLKYIESINLSEIHLYLHRFSPRNSCFYETLWCETYEKLFNLKVDFLERARRMLFFELNYSRVSLQYLSDIFFFLREESLANRLSSLVKHINEIDRMYEDLINDHLKVYPMSSLPISGVWKTFCAKKISVVLVEVEDIKAKITTSNNVLSYRFGDDKRSSVSLGLTGYTLRSNGISYDIRANDNFYLYNELENNRPLGLSGSLYDRLLVRLEDTYQSLHDTIRVLESFESRDGIFKTDLMNKKCYDDKVLFSYTETPTGELSYLCTVSENSDKLDTFSVSTPSDINLNYIEGINAFKNIEEIQLQVLSLGVTKTEVMK